MATLVDNALSFTAKDEEITLLKKGTNEFVLLQLLTQDKTITELSFFGCQLEDKDLKIILSLIKKCPHITSLDLSENYLTDLGFSFLKQHLPKTMLKTLNVSGNQKVTIEGLNDLTLGMKDTPIRTLSLSRLIVANMGPNVINNLQGSQVEKLDLSTTGMTAQCARGIVENLLNTSIRELNISSNSLGDEGVRTIVQQADKLKLRALDVSYNQLTGNVVVDIAHNSRDTTLTTISIHGTALLPKALADLEAALHFNKTHNTPDSLSKAYLTGFQLTLLERSAERKLSRDVAYYLGGFATDSKTQQKAFALGWDAANKEKAAL